MIKMPAQESRIRVCRTLQRLCRWCMVWPAALACLPASAAGGQAAGLYEYGKPVVESFSPKSYKAGAQNWAITQTPEGLLYFANNTGVLEFDGLQWRLIAVSNHSGVRSLDCDAAGRVFVGAQGEMGYLAPDEQGKLRYVSLVPHIPDAFRDFADIAKIYCLPDGVYFQAIDRLFRWSGNQMKVWKPQTPFHLSFAVRGQLYIRRPGLGLLRVVGDSLELAPAGAQFSEERIYFMLPFGEHEILIGTRTRGLFVYDGARNRPFPSLADSFLQTNQIYHAARLSDGGFAIATLRGGVIVIDARGGVAQLFDEAIGLPDLNVKFVFPDLEDNLWLALNNGLTRVEYPSVLSRFEKDAGLEGAVEDIVRFAGRLYFATGRGVYKLEPGAVVGAQAGQFTRAAFRPVPGIAVPCWALLPFGENLLVAGSDGIYEIRREHARRVLRTPDEAYVLHRWRRRPDRVLVGMRRGLMAIRRVNGGWQADGMVETANAEVRSIAESAAGEIWLGTRSSGFWRILPTGSSLAASTIDNFTGAEGLPANHGWVEAAALGDRLIFGTDRGFCRFDSSRGRFAADTAFVDEFSDGEQSVGNLAADAAGNLWLKASGSAGIGVARRQKDGSYRWDNRAFRRYADFIVWSIYPDPETSSVWIGGPDGVLRYEDRPDRRFTAPLHALLRRVSVRADSAIFSGAGFPGASWRQGSPLVLPYADNALRFEYAAASFTEVSANQFQYKLEGFDRRWSEWSFETRKDYTNVPEGAYAFHVRARNLYGVTSEVAGFAFRILPPWYRRWWAYLLYISMAIALIFGFNKWRTRQLEEKSRALEKVVQERTEEIRQQAEELKTLDGIVQTINRELDLDQVLRALLEQGLKLFPQAEKAVFFLGDAGNAHFRVVATAGYPPDAFKDLVFTRDELSDRYSKGTRRAGEGVYILQQFENIAGAEKLRHIPTPKSVLAMTVVIGGQTEGYLVFDNFHDAEGFDASDAHKLNRFREHAVSAIAKAKIIKEVQEKNEELVRTQNQLVTQEKLASLGALTAGIAHEIKNPLNFVNNFAELTVELADELREDLQKSRDKFAEAAYRNIEELLDDLRQNAAKINEHGKRADSIVKGMLLHSRGKAGEFEPTDLNHLLDEYVNLTYHGMRAQSNAFNITIEKNYDESVGTLPVIPQDLSRVFLNLLNNACYAAFEKKKTAGADFSPLLRVTTKNQGDHVEIRIWDNGPGIPDDIRQKIFNPFFTTKPTGQGTGLGLSISYDIIVQGHKGSLQFETRPGEFTEFIIQLPRSA